MAPRPLAIPYYKSWVALALLLILTTRFNSSTVDTTTMTVSASKTVLIGCNPCHAAEVKQTPKILNFQGFQICAYFVSSLSGC